MVLFLRGERMLVLIVVVVLCGLVDVVLLQGGEKSCLVFVH